MCVIAISDRHNVHFDSPVSVNRRARQRKVERNFCRTIQLKRKLNAIPTTILPEQWKIVFGTTAEKVARIQQAEKTKTDIKFVLLQRNFCCSNSDTANSLLLVTSKSFRHFFFVSLFCVSFNVNFAYAQNSCQFPLFVRYSIVRVME